MILNAKITSADIFIEDHDILTFAIGIETSAGWSTSIGCFYLDWTKDEERVPAPYTSKVIRAILETVGIRSWSDLVGKYIRIDDTMDMDLAKIGLVECNIPELSEGYKLSDYDVMQNIQRAIQLSEAYLKQEEKNAADN